MEIYIQIIKTEWRTKLELISNNNSKDLNSLNSLQEWTIVVSQLIQPTLDLLINAGILYFTSQACINKNEEMLYHNKLESAYNSIQEILENYSIDPSIINEVMKEIAKQFLKI